MLTHPILDQLLELKLTGMHRALAEQLRANDLGPLSFEERLGCTATIWMRRARRSG